MRACLLLCAALALVASRPRAAAHEPAPAPAPALAPLAPALEPARIHHIKTQILAKLGLTSRPMPLGAPPRDVVRQILARAADPQPERRPEPEPSMREIIAIAHRGVAAGLVLFTMLAVRKITKFWLTLSKCCKQIEDYITMATS